MPVDLTPAIGVLYEEILAYHIGENVGMTAQPISRWQAACVTGSGQKRTNHRGSKSDFISFAKKGGTAPRPERRAACLLCIAERRPSPARIRRAPSVQLVPYANGISALVLEMLVLS